MSADVLLISGSFAPREGGAEKQMRRVLAQFASQGQDVVVLTQVLPEYTAVTKAVIDNIKVRRLGSPQLFKYLPRLGALTFLLGAILTGLNERPKAILTLQLGAASVAGSLLSRIFKVPLIVRLTGGGSTKFRSEPFARMSSIQGRLLMRMISRRETTIVAPAQHLLSDFRECVPDFRGQTKHIMNGVDEKSTANIVRKPQVAWYSRRGSEKSYETFREVAEILRDIPFVVIGHYDGPALPENVAVLGWQTHPERVLAESSVLLNTSPAEGMPNTVLQSLAHGCRVVGLSNAGMREVEEMFPRSVELVSPSQTDVLAARVRGAVFDTRPVVAEVPTSSMVLEEWALVLREATDKV